MRATVTDRTVTRDLQAAEASPARGLLSRERILQASLRLIDQQGLEAFTMRKLAQELRVDPMSIYRHFESKDALLDGVAEVLWREIVLPQADTDAQSLLRALANSLRALGHAHPHAYVLLLNRPSCPLALLWLVDVILEQLQRAGFERKRASEIICTISSYAVGFAMVELSALLPTPSERGAVGMTNVGRVTQVMRRLPRETPAHLVEIACELTDCNTDAQFALGLDLMLTGLATRQG
jgi:AcrR family transcriptional regulator